MESVPSSGSVVGFRFVLEQEIGRGGTSVVWAAWDTASGRRVALKLIAPSDAHDRGVNDRFARECEVLLRCQMPHVVAVEATGHDERHGLFLAMELLEGETLEQRLVREGVMSARDFLRVAEDVLDALAYLHQCGVTHRDIKPANIWLTKGAGGELGAKLLDFGTVKLGDGVDRHGRTQAGALVGTPSRMSPEQMRGGPIDHRCDVWGFAMAAFEAIVGSPAIDGTMPIGQAILTVCHGRLPVPSELNASVDRRFDAWFARSTVLAPEGRFDDVTRQLIALQEALAPSTVASRIVCPRVRVQSMSVDVELTMTLPPLTPRKGRSSPSAGLSAHHPAQDRSAGR